MCKNFIYLAKIDLQLGQDAYDGLLQIISEENRQRCKRFMFREDALRTLYGELMLRYMLMQHFSIRHEDIQLLKDESGKPYLKGLPVHFNISHSGDYVVCAVSEQPVGIDIERIKEVDFKLAERYFCKSEYRDLFAREEIRRLDYFFSLWTLKESYLKWLGTGMSVPLDSIAFKIGSEISMIDTCRSARPFFKQFPIDGYKLSLCSMNAGFADDIKEISLEEMKFFTQGDN
ncbi:MAG: 4'-phosphopantetheinyl transferase superfamily protein [Defluviitaleaceae bacterium]|nr:4'-phosphopantetheinyl transferase superfamily protein [Defluviitaleaceae bacterium]